LAILLGFEEGGQFEYALFRTMDTFIGLAISTLINYFVFPHDVGGKVADEIFKTINEMVAAIDKHSESFELELFDRDLKVVKSHFDTLQKEIKLFASPQYDIVAVKKIIETFEGVYHHMVVLDALFEDSTLENLSIVRAYHTDKIKTLIKSIEPLKKH